VCGGGADGGVTCVGLQCQQVTCSQGGTTSITGTVYDPAGKVGLPNAYVYVPNCAVQPFTAVASCSQCSTGITGCPLVITTTDVNGNFTLSNMPVGSSIPVVIQIGKWRRQITVPTITRCGNTNLAASLTHLPQNQSQGDIPLIALTTGAVDPLECLLRKIGISDTEFTNPGGGGRVNFYTGYNNAPVVGASPTSSYAAALGGATFPDATTLWNTQSSLQAYDATLLGCEGIPTTANKSSAALSAMQGYVNTGGRVFGSHYHYVWLQSGPNPWPGLVSWNPTLEEFYDPTSLNFTVNETVLTGFPKGLQMNQWMKIWAGATSGTPSLFPVTEARRSILSINDTTNVTDWIVIPSGTTCTPQLVGHRVLCVANGVTYTNVPQYFSFNGPVGQTPSCGRFVFSDIHVASGDTTGKAFPTGCTTTTMSPQELALEFMFFDLASPVCSGPAPPPPPTCTPLTCAQAGVQCGQAPDGCGGLLNCPPCTAPQTCGGGGVPGKCGQPICTPQTCASLGLTCGVAGDGCGGTITCGPSCPTPDAGSCVPETCGGRCGPQGDGCGGILSCPPCEAGTCVPTTCSAQHVGCSTIGDGCGGTIDCGSCTPPQTCGGGGTPYQCGGGVH
jgi:hypothetical protein